MSVTTESRPARVAHRPDTTPCEQCGTPLDPDQEWCLECGSARTLVHRPPDWRIAAGIVATVIVLVLAGFAIALINLSADSNRSAATTVTVTSTVQAAPPAPKKPAGVANWPVGLPGWTVVLFSTTTRRPAVAKARHLSAAGLRVGVLSTSRHPSGNMPPGRFAVFTGRYPTQQAALARVNTLRAKGYHARARRVGSPGGP